MLHRRRTERPLGNLSERAPWQNQVAFHAIQGGQRTAEPQELSILLSRIPNMARAWSASNYFQMMQVGIQASIFVIWHSLMPLNGEYPADALFPYC